MREPSSLVSDPTPRTGTSASPRSPWPWSRTSRRVPAGSGTCTPSGGPPWCRVRRAVLAPTGEGLDVEAPVTPQDVLDAFAAAARSAAELAPSTMDAIEEADLGPSPYRWTAAGRRAFLDILAAGRPGARALEA